MYTCYTSQSEYSISFFWLSFHPQELKKPRTGVSTEGGGVTAASWKWYSLMDEALGARPSVTPPVLFASSSREVAGLPPPPVFTPLPVATQASGASSTVSTPRRRRVDTVDIVALVADNDSRMSEAMRELEERLQRRDEARERQTVEATEREESRYRESVEREERRHRESVEREESRFRRQREGEERREREAAAREDRLLDILEKFASK